MPEWDSGAQLFWAYAARERALRGNQKVASPEFQAGLVALRPKVKEAQYWPEFDWPALTSALDEIRKKPK